MHTGMFVRSIFLPLVECDNSLNQVIPSEKIKVGSWKEACQEGHINSESQKQCPFRFVSVQPGGLNEENLTI